MNAEPACEDQRNRFGNQTSKLKETAVHAQTQILLTREQELRASGECDDDGRPLARQVFFEADNWLVPESYGNLLAAHAAWLADRPERVVLVSGHSYGTGSHRFFWLMGDRRAIAVRSALLKKRNR